MDDVTPEPKRSDRGLEESEMKAVCTKLKRLGEMISSPTQTCTDLPDSARTMFVDSKLPDSERAPFTSDSIGISPTVLDEEFETHTADDMPEHLGTYVEPDTFVVLSTEKQIVENRPSEHEEKAVIAMAKSHRPNLVRQPVKGDGTCFEPWPNWLEAKRSMNPFERQLLLKSVEAPMNICHFSQNLSINGVKR